MPETGHFYVNPVLVDEYSPDESALITDYNREELQELTAMLKSGWLLETELPPAVGRTVF